MKPLFLIGTGFTQLLLADALAFVDSNCAGSNGVNVSFFSRNFLLLLFWFGIFKNVETDSFLGESENTL